MAHLLPACSVVGYLCAVLLGSLVWVPATLGGEDTGRVQPGQQVYGFISGASEDTRFVDSSHQVIAEWTEVSGLLSESGLPATSSLKGATVVVPSDLLTDVRKLLLDVSRSAQRPNEVSARIALKAGTVSAIERHIVNELTNPVLAAYTPYGESGIGWTCGIAGVARSSDENGLVVDLARILMISPQSLGGLKPDLSSMTTRALVVDESGRHELPFCQLKFVGDDEFLALCRLNPILEEYSSDQGSYLRQVFLGKPREIVSHHERLLAATKEITELARKKAYDQQYLRHEFQSLGLSTSDASAAARELTEKSGRRVLQLLEETLNGSDDPLGSATRLVQQRIRFSKAVPVVVLKYVSEKFSNRFGLLVMDGRYVYVCSVNAALCMHSRFMISQGIFDESLGLSEIMMNKAPDRSLADLRQVVLAVSPADFPSWPAASELTSQLPAVPTRPVEPVDPYVAAAKMRQSAAQASLAQEHARQHAFQQNAVREEMEQLDHQADMDLARGDIDGFFEKKQAVGAAAAAEIGDPGLLRMFGSAGQVAQLERQHRMRGPPAVHVPLVVERPADYQSQPEWQEYLVELDAYQAALEEYETRMRVREEAVEEMAKKLAPTLRKKQEKALEDLDELSRVNVSTVARFKRLSTSKAEPAKASDAESKKSWFIPSFLPLIDGGELLNSPAEYDKLHIIPPP